jgi:hypothetical protein
MQKRKPPKEENSESISVPDFDDDQSNPSNIPEFNEAMRGLVNVPKSEVDAELHHKKKHKRAKR